MSNNLIILSTHEFLIIFVGTLVGTLARLATLREDYRQYPSYPNGYFIQLVTGFIAASLGAVAIPALLTKNYTAMTFLALGIQQFRNVRRMEAQSMQNLEQTEFTYRGNAYIDGIAKTFEARNYMCLIVALSSSTVNELVDRFFPLGSWGGLLLGAFVGCLVLFGLIRFSKGKTVGDIAEITPGHVEVKGSELFVDGIYVSNLLGADRARKMVENEALAVVIYPKAPHFRLILDNFGQRQAMLFEVGRALGIKRYSFTRKDYEKGRVVIALVPIEKNLEKFIQIVKNTPLLESVKKSPSLMDPKG
jgi:hypothetical protein